MTSITLAIEQVKINGKRRTLRGVEDLSESIKLLGLLNPITVTPDNTLIAGYHRLEACKLLGWSEIPVQVIDLGKLETELAEIDENLIRNDLTVLERSEALVRRKQIYLAMHPETENVNKRGGPGRGHKKTNDKVSLVFTEDTATKTKQSRRTIERELQIADKLDRNVRDKIRETDLADKKTELLKLCKLDKDEQLELVDLIVSGEVKTVKKAKREILRKKKTAIPADLSDSDSYRVIHGEMQDVGKTIPDESVNFIITDPPYKQESLNLFDELAELAERVLKPGGSLLCMSGQSYLPRVIKALSQRENLKYHWMVAYLTPGGQAAQLWTRKVNTFWKPVLWYVKGEYIDDWVGDVVKSEPNDNDKRFHDWGQSESGMTDLIERFTLPGQTILDPFMGAGTTGVVAVCLGRKFIGIDMNEESVKLAAARLAEVSHHDGA